jgi:hypothetical protein
MAAAGIRRLNSISRGDSCPYQALVRLACYSLQMQVKRLPPEHYKNIPETPVALHPFDPQSKLP